MPADNTSTRRRVGLKNSKFKAIVFCVFTPERRGRTRLQASRPWVDTVDHRVFCRFLIHDVKYRPLFLQLRSRVRLRSLRQNAAYEQRANMSNGLEQRRSGAGIGDGFAHGGDGLVDMRSVVAQLQTEMRITRMPRQVAPPNQATPFAWMRLITSSVRRS